MKVVDAIYQWTGQASLWVSDHHFYLLTMFVIIALYTWASLSEG